MAKITILMGLPGSGKSTWAKKNKDASTMIINRDALRSMVAGGEYVFNKEDEPTIKRMAQAVARAAMDGWYNLIIDECNIKDEHRKYWTDAFGVDHEYHLIHFTESENNAELRMKDSRGLSLEYWKNIIDGMKTSFMPPTEDEKRYFNKIKIIKIGDM